CALPIFERALHSRLQPKVTSACAVQHAARWSIVPTLHVLLNPVIGTQVVKPVSRLSKVGISSWKSRFLNLLLQDRIDRLKASPKFFRVIIAVEEIHNGLCPVWYFPPQVNSLEPESLDQMQ